MFCFWQKARPDTDDIDNLVGRFGKCAVEEEIIVPERAPEQSAQGGRKSKEEETVSSENPAKMDTKHVARSCYISLFL